MPQNIKKKFPSELRSDPLSKDWVIIATGRAKRPETFKKETGKEFIAPKSSCPFCRIMKKTKDDVLVVPNKYPALIPSDHLNERSVGPNLAMDGVGHHEVVITRDHQKSIGQLPLHAVEKMVHLYQERYLDLMNEKFIKYVSIFHNHGHEAGASIFHPHSQIIASPVMDPDLDKALFRANDYFQKKHECIYCMMNEWERKAKERVVFENKDFIAVCPYASKTAFEMIISPKRHLPYFERLYNHEKTYFAEALTTALGKLYKGLNNPAYNFYLHTAPCDGQNYNFYHWHLTILPKTAVSAGFELSTGIEISTIEPEKAAEYLRKQ